MLTLKKMRENFITTVLKKFFHNSDTSVIETQIIPGTHPPLLPSIQKFLIRGYCNCVRDKTQSSVSIYSKKHRYEIFWKHAYTQYPKYNAL